MSLLKRLLVKAAFYPSLIFNRTMTGLGLWHRWDWVDEDLLLGCRPRRREVAELHKLGIDAVVNMCEEFPGHKDELKRCDMDQLWLPTLDFHSPTADDMERGVRFIAEHAAAGKKTYVHCKAGRGRAATLTLCYLIAKRRLSADEAVKLIREARPHIDRRIERRQAVAEIERRVRSGKLDITPPSASA